MYTIHVLTPKHAIALFDVVDNTIVLNSGRIVLASQSEHEANASNISPLYRIDGSRVFEVRYKECIVCGKPSFMANDQNTCAQCAHTTTSD